MKTFFKLAMPILLLTSLVGCKKESGTLTGTLTIEPGKSYFPNRVGRQVTMEAKVNEESIADPTLVTYSAKDGDTSAFTIDGNQITFLQEGKHDIVASYKTDEMKQPISTSYTFDVLGDIPVKSIKEAKALSKEYNNNKPISDTNPVPAEVKVRGVVISNYGTGGVIADNDDAIEIYSWYYNQDGRDTAIYQGDGDTKSKLHNLDEVVVTCLIYDFYSQPQLEKSYKVDGTFKDLPEASIIKVQQDDEQIKNWLQPVTISTEDQLKEFTSDSVKERTGHPYKIEGAEYVRQAPQKSNGKDYTIFKIGSTEFSLLTAGTSSKKTDVNIDSLVTTFEGLSLNAGDKVDITTTFIGYEKKDGDQSKVGPKFSFYSEGTKIEKTNEPVVDA